MLCMAKRFLVFAVSSLLVMGILGYFFHWVWWLLLPAVPLIIIGIVDMLQTKHAIMRNFPVVGRARYWMEALRPKVYQYFVESDTGGSPINRVDRSTIYQRAKRELDTQPFGTQFNVYAEGYEWMAHSIQPRSFEHMDKDPRVTIGGSDCTQPYSASILNVSAMSYGSLSSNAVEALNGGAKLGNFAHNTGEGGISQHHLNQGGDIIWQIGTGYFGCRNDEGNFDERLFEEKTALSQIKMVELKLSQGAKPGHGGILPAAKVTPEIAATRGVPVGQDCISPPSHSAFSTPLEMMAFIAQLRELSGGKPVGFKLCLGHPWEFMGMVKAMLESGIVPDFIVVDGAEGGTGAAPVEFSDHIGLPMREGLLFVHNVLVGAGLRERVKIGVAGRIVSAFDIASVLAIGADWANAARGFMFALGCVQSLSCNTNRCPTGVATQDAVRQRALVVPDKAQRVHRFHANTLHALADMLAAAGLTHPEELGPHHLVRRVSATEIRLFSDLHVFLQPGELLTGLCEHAFYRRNWDLARAESFDRLS